jgi:hypothetical protein
MWILHATLRIRLVPAGATVTAQISEGGTVPSSRSIGRVAMPVAILGLLMWQAPLVRAAAPTIVSFSPTSGGPGTVVTVSGTDLAGATAVTFGGASATFRCCRGGSIRATVPAGVATGPIEVTTAEGTAVSTTDFLVLPPPVITGFTPACAGWGEEVTVFGSGFTGTTRMSFRRNRADVFTVVDDSTIVVTVPVGAGGTLSQAGPIVVETPGGTALSPDNFHTC